MKSFGLFSGIGGFEYSLEKHGVECAGLCEIDPAAKSVLRSRFPNVRLHSDVTQLGRLPNVEVLTAGFPCQDLSQAGAKIGIRGERSKLIDHVFRLIETAKKKPKLVLLENVSYMLRLNKGDAMRYVLQRAEEQGYNWAYRTLDARAFGLPQRRERVIIVLSLSGHPSEALFGDGYVEPEVNDVVGPVDRRCLYGFYWTEGKRGLGWVKDAVPTIKGGSGLGIPSPPAIWSPRSGRFGTPSICDAERMFGFEAGWTSHVSEAGFRDSARWHLVGNTICVPMVDWVVEQLQAPKGMQAQHYKLNNSDRLPSAAYGNRQSRFGVTASTWPLRTQRPMLAKFLNDDLKPLSWRAASGFYRRTTESTAIRFADGFLESLREYIASIGCTANA